MIEFKATKAEYEIISAIADRAVSMAAAYGLRYPKMDAVMDLSACHSNGCPLKLKELAAADDYNFAHDVFGIYKHIDRETGKLGDCFLPRFAQCERALHYPIEHVL